MRVRRKPLVVPTRLSYLAMLCDAAQRDQAWSMVCDLARRFDLPPPPPGAVHYSADFGSFRLKWERHTEFARYQFIVAGANDEPFAQPAILAAPAEWVASLPGQVMVATHVALMRADDIPADYDAISARYFDGNILVGAAIGGSAATALMDFRIHADGFSRIVVLDRSMTSRQAGRMVQRLLEIDTYRMMALLALPVARELAPLLTRAEQELANITAALVSANSDDEAMLLERLTKLEAEIDSRKSANIYRFSAADAYYELVQTQDRRPARAAHRGDAALPGVHRTAAGPGDEHLARRCGAAGFPVGTAGARGPAAVDPCRYHARGSEPESPRIDEPPRQAATSAAADGRRACRSRRSPTTSSGWSAMRPRAARRSV